MTKSSESNSIAVAFRLKMTMTKGLVEKLNLWRKQATDELSEFIFGPKLPNMLLLNFNYRPLTQASSKKGAAGALADEVPSWL